MRRHERIVRNSLICRNCGDEIESRHTHDFKWCKCGDIAVDGGREYLRRVGNLDGYRDTSVMEQLDG